MKIILLISFLIFNFVEAKGTLSEATYKKLLKAQKHIEKDEYKEAKTILLDIVEKQNNISKSYALQELANIYIASNDYNEVAKSYEQILKLNSFEQKDLDSIKLSLSQIYLSQEKYDKTIKYSFELLESKTANKNIVYQNLALSYYYKKEYDDNIFYTKKVIETTDAIAKKESWYRMLYSSYISLDNYSHAIKTLKVMVKHYPTKEDYWLQLVSAYQTVKEYKRSLATMELGYGKNFIDKKKHTLYLVNILLQNENYNKAASLIEISIKNKIIEDTKKNFDLLVAAHLNAKNIDRIISLLTHSKHAKTEKYVLLLSNLYYNEGKYSKVIATLENFKFKKHSKKDGRKSILMALSYFELNFKKESELFLKKASRNKYEKRRAKNIAKELNFHI
ncbi:MAG: hypothetical protein WBG69_10535 [Arcobacteraceae bacterium]